ncbi:MAG TPA: helix-turn-helix domain-containing protein [Rectinemataceae bacterium]|nr:helix-turn-helix domain-containing protein [Rectinemataceae bacterium]
MDIETLFERPADLSLLPPEERILIAALDCIAEDGLAGATVRSIAGRAGLNAAAVNYYFRSKEKLIEAALQRAWTHVSEDLDRIMVESAGASEGLVFASRFLLEGAFRYPNIIRALILEHPKLRVEAALYFRTHLERLQGPAAQDMDTGLGTALLLSFAMFMGIAPDAAAALVGEDLRDQAARDRIAARAAPRFFTT